METLYRDKLYSNKTTNKTTNNTNNKINKTTETKNLAQNSSLSAEENINKKIQEQNDMLLNAIGLLEETNEISEKTLEQTQKNTQKIKILTQKTSEIKDGTITANNSLKRIEMRRKFYGLLDWYYADKKK